MPQAQAARRRELMTALAPFGTPSTRRATWQVASTVLAYLALTALAYGVVPLSPWLALPLAVPAGGLVVRLFAIQHDCGHGSLFRSRRMNDRIGRLCSLLTFTPYAFWRRQHANHHASFNNLDRREPGIDLYTACATLAEYRAMPPVRRLLYRAIRHPVLTQLVLPPLVFLLVYRVPFDAPRDWTRERRSVWLTNLSLAAALACLAVAFSPSTVALVQLPPIAVASIVGVWLFSVQHRFEGSMWEREGGWSHVAASLEGTSFLKLPRVLQWFSGNIGFHHIHHLSSRVPNYRLQECHEARAELHPVTTLTLREALFAPLYALWDEEGGRMVRF